MSYEKITEQAFLSSKENRHRVIGRVWGASCSGHCASRDQSHCMCLFSCRNVVLGFPFCIFSNVGKLVGSYIEETKAKGKTKFEFVFMFVFVFFHQFP